MMTDFCELCGDVLTEEGSLAYDGLVVCEECFEESLEEGDGQTDMTDQVGAIAAAWAVCSANTTALRKMKADMAERERNLEKKRLFKKNYEIAYKEHLRRLSEAETEAGR